MTTGYVFRTENQAMVGFMRRVGRSGQLVTLNVESLTPTGDAKRSTGFLSPIRELFDRTHKKASMLYAMCVLLTVAALGLIRAIHDDWALAVLSLLIAARFLNMVALERRFQRGWKGAPEPGKQSDLLVLMSQDRWVRIKGSTDDVKAVTSGQWLRDPTTTEDVAAASATLLVYLAAVLGFNASTLSSLIIAALLVLSAALLGSSNAMIDELHMYGLRVSVVDGPRPYPRRLTLAEELIKQVGRDDWAVAMGLILPPEGSARPPSEVLL